MSRYPSSAGELRWFTGMRSLLFLPCAITHTQREEQNKLTASISPPRTGQNGGTERVQSIHIGLFVTLPVDLGAATRRQYYHGNIPLLK